MTHVLSVSFAVLCAASLTLAGEPVVQPTTVPGEWKLSTGALPAAPPAGRRPVYGVYAWAGEYRTHRASIGKIGWKSVRFGGPLDDRTARMIVEDDVELMMTLGTRVTGSRKNRSHYPSDEAFIADYLEGIDRFLTRYGPRGTFYRENPGLPDRPVKYVEIWNEPNFQYMIPPDGRPRRELNSEREKLYAKVLPAAYAAIKKKWPGVTVVGFACGGAASADVGFAENVHANDPKVAGSYDIFSTHPYTDPVPPDAENVRSWGSFSIAGNYRKLRGILGKNGRGDVPMWYTEIGWAVSEKDGGHFSMRRRDNQFATPLLQAAYVVRTYALAMRLGARRVHIMFATDTDNYNGGFFLRDGSWRPSAHAARTMIALMPHPALERVFSDGEGGFFAWRFKPGGKNRAPVVMAWNVAEPRTVGLPLGRGAFIVTDMLGTSKRVRSSGGKLTIEVGPCPVYVQAVKTTAEKRGPRPAAPLPKPPARRKPKPKARPVPATRAEPLRRGGAPKPAPAEEKPPPDAALAKLYGEAETAFIDGDVGRAKALFEKVVRDHPESEYAGKAKEYLEIIE